MVRGVPSQAQPCPPRNNIVVSLAYDGDINARGAVIMRVGLVIAIVAALAACSKAPPPQADMTSAADSSTSDETASIGSPSVANSPPSSDPYLALGARAGQGVPEGAYPAKGRPVPDAIEKEQWEAGMIEARIQDEQLQGIATPADPKPQRKATATAEPGVH